MKRVLIEILTLMLVTFVNCQRVQNFTQIGQTFMTQFYNIFDSPQRSSIKDFYESDSIYVYHGEMYNGAMAIIDKFNILGTNQNSALSVNNMRSISWYDSQPTNDGGVILNVGGFLSPKDASTNSATSGSFSNATRVWFNEMFVLKPRVTSFFVQNQHFRSSDWRNNNNINPTNTNNNTNGLYFV